MKVIALLSGAAFLAAPISPAFAQHYTQVNLVANTPGVAPITDANLVNPWGLSRASGSPWWISENGTGLSTLYAGNGAIVPLVVTIPKANPQSKAFPTGTPTGTIANSSTTDFLLAPGLPAAFLFSTIDGSIAAWSSAVGVAPGAAPPSKQAITVFKAMDGSSYTGLTAATINGHRYLYAANFTKGRVDLFDSAFHRVKLPNPNERYDHSGRYGDEENRAFVDERLPHNFVPFNVQTIGNDIVVTYALHQEGNPFETDGEGLGFVDIFSSDGRLLQRLEHGRWLNAPWGVALAPLDFGVFSHALLIGQFAGGANTEFGGSIAAYDLTTGAFLGLVKDATGKTLSIPGLWAISPGNSASANSYDASAAPAGELYFTAGPDHGANGLFGYLKPLANEMVQGNDQ